MGGQNTGGGMGSNTGYGQVRHGDCRPGCHIRRFAALTASDASCTKAASSSAAEALAGACVAARLYQM